MRNRFLRHGATWLVRGALTAILPFGAKAQATASTAAASSLAQRADSIAFLGDTAQAYALLDTSLKRNKADGPAWHQFGLLNWNMARSGRSAQYIKDKRVIRLLSAADSALRLATQYSPDSARYWLSLTEFNLKSGVSTMRFAASGQVTNAFSAAAKAGDSLLMAVAADGVGMAVWRRYEAIANRALVADGQKVQLSNNTMFNRRQARDYVETFAKKIEPPTGTADYSSALTRFKQAVAIDPTALRYSRHLYMAYAERGRWDEMLNVATERAGAFPMDAQAQLARGLALHRLGKGALSQVAFDSAFTLMDPDESARLSRFSRILRPAASKESKGSIGDSVAYAALPEGQRRGLEAMYWLMNDPLSLTNENESRLEFLSRVVYSDFRWTNDDFNLLGADTDRGDVYVRYGPPDFEVNIPGSSSNEGFGNSDGSSTLVWSYDVGMTFFFDLPPGFGVARFAFADKDAVDMIRSNLPVSFANLPSTRLMDTIPLRITRFRTRTDSADVVVAARIPLDSLVRSLNVARVPVEVDFRVFDQFVRVKGVESVQTTVENDSTATTQSRVWQRRLGPGINVVRVEALQADSRRAARAVTRLNPEATSGFGISDILLGSKPALRGSNAPGRWTDVEITPNVGDFAPGASVGLVWEMYDLAAKDGNSQYRLAISVERTERGGALGFAVRVADGLGRAVGRTQQGRDKFTITFDKTAAAAATLVEYLSLDMASSPAGSYRLRVEVTDLATQKKSSRDTEFRIR